MRCICSVSAITTMAPSCSLIIIRCPYSRTLVRSKPLCICTDFCTSSYDYICRIDDDPLSMGFIYRAP